MYRIVDIDVDSGNTFVHEKWISVRNDMRDINNWFIQDDSISPMEKK